MRIISGKYKGRMLDGFSITGTRPTMDRVKESLFAMIQDYIKDSTCLDLFSGSGNLALESLSEGSKKAYLVDNNIKAIKVINSNLEKLGINTDHVVVLKDDFKNALLKLSNEQNKFDIIFLDPPYQTTYLKESLHLIEKYNLLSSSGIVICESDSKDKIIYSTYYQELKSKQYGEKIVVILKKNINN